MNKKFIVFTLMAVLVVLGLGSCASSKGAAGSHNLTGVYAGTIPAADAEGINVRLKLNKDNTYELTYEYIGKPANSFTNKGAFTWNDAGDIINLGIADTPSYYKVTDENKLIQLDMEGKPITGNFADNYVLTKGH